MGARPRPVAGQFLTDSAVLGLLGDAVGSSVGVVVVIATALIQRWTAILDPRIVFTAPLLGLGIGLLAGLYPWVRAATVERWRPCAAKACSEVAGAGPLIQASSPRPAIGASRTLLPRSAK